MELCCLEENAPRDSGAATHCETPAFQPSNYYYYYYYFCDLRRLKMNTKVKKLADKKSDSMASPEMAMMLLSRSFRIRLLLSLLNVA